MEIISEGANIGISFSGLSGFLLILWFMLEIVMIATTKTSFIHKVILYFFVRYRVRKLIPDWWKITNVGFITTDRVRYNRWSVYVKIDRNIPGYEDKWTNEHFEVNRFGVIKEGSFENGITLYDRDLDSYKVLQNRNKSLEKLGI